jgi:hypothetical protein
MLSEVVVRLITDKEEGYLSGFMFGIGIGIMIGYYIL